MINNNLDYEKTTSASSPPPSTTALGLTADTSPNANMPMPGATPPAAITTKTTTTKTKGTGGNDNSYFNRFDNRIAANLAAVINGARLRSASWSKSTRHSSSTTTAAATTGSTSAATAANATLRQVNANANAYADFSNSSTNLNATASRDRSPYQNGSATATTPTHQSLRGTTRQQAPPTYLHLYNGSRSKPSSPMLGNKNHQQHGLPPNGGGGSGSMGRRRGPLHLFAQANLNCNDNEKALHTPSSEEDNSPTELNNCKRLAEKPPLVKRLTMGLLRSHEESRPLVNAATPTTAAATTTTTGATHGQAGTGTCNQIYSNGYINEEAFFEPEKLIAAKFGDSCRQSLTAIPMLDTVNFNDNSEFNLKKRYLRETSSANSSPKIFANRLRQNAAAMQGRHQHTGSSTLSRTHTNTHHTNTNSISNGGALGSTTPPSEDEEADLKEASWFQAGISRDIAVEVLANKSPGAFLVRKSTSKPGCYALTLRVPSPPGPKTANYIILRTANGYKIKGFRKEFTTLKALITHHSVMPELLPVPLALPRPTNMTSSRRNLDDFDTYDSLQMLLKYLRAKNLENE